VVLGACGADDVGAAGRGDLHGQVADATRGRVDEHALPGRMSAVSTSACQAVSRAIGNAAASTSLAKAGAGAKCRAGAATYSA
jgi:hypothetical protein